VNTEFSQPSGPGFVEPLRAATDSPGGPAPPIEFQPLDRRVIKLWRVDQVIGSLVLFAIAGVAVVVVGVSVEHSWPWLLLGLAGLFLLRVWWFFWYPPRAYRAWGYRLDGKVLETRHGLWFRVTQLLPLSRLQHVDLHSGPIERSFGLASLLLHTAGTQNATITIPGLDGQEATRLRDQLVSVGGDDAV
jgi:hypothetical protein